MGRNLKEIVFEEMLYRSIRYSESVKDLGYWDATSQRRKATTDTVAAIIETAGLEEEYQDWKKARKENMNK